MIFWVAAIFLLPVSPIWPPRRPFLPYGRPNLALLGFLLYIYRFLRLGLMFIKLHYIHQQFNHFNVSGPQRDTQNGTLTAPCNTTQTNRTLQCFHTGHMLLNKFGNKLLNLYSPCISTEPFTLATSSATCVRVLSHWPHVRQFVAELVRQHVASVKALLLTETKSSLEQ